MNILISSLLVLAVLLPQVQEQAGIHRVLSVVFVEPVGEQFTNEEKDVELEKLRIAIHYWEELSPVTTTLTLLPQTSTITAEADIFDQPYVSHQSLADQDLLILIFDNSQSQETFYNYALGLALPSLIYIVSSTGADVYAHELGHAVYNLPHQYHTDYDIMNLYPLAAFQLHRIGCGSLAELGRACTSVYLPVISR